MTLLCVLCGGLCEVTPTVRHVPGEGVPRHCGVLVDINRACCAGCARRVVALFARSVEPCAAAVAEDEDDDDLEDDDSEDDDSEDDDSEDDYIA